MTTRDRCPTCQREIFWLRHENTGKPGPIQVSEPFDGLVTGNVVVLDDQLGPCGIDVATTYRMLGRKKGEPLPQTGFVSHHARCRDAPHFEDRAAILGGASETL